jgi:hypothetical protein
MVRNATLGPAAGLMIMTKLQPVLLIPWSRLELDTSTTQNGCIITDTTKKGCKQDRRKDSRKKRVWARNKQTHT